MNDQEFQCYEKRLQLKTLVYFIPAAILIYALIAVMIAGVISETNLPLFDADAKVTASLGY